MSEPVSSLPVTMMNGVSYDIRTGLEGVRDLEDPSKDKLYWIAKVYVGGAPLHTVKNHRTEEEAYQEGLEWARAHSRKKT